MRERFYSSKWDISKTKNWIQIFIQLKCIVHKSKIKAVFISLFSLGHVPFPLTDRMTVPSTYSLEAPCLRVDFTTCHALRGRQQKKYITGVIRPSSSLLGSGFFFVDKKDKTLRSCIDFRGLNDITIKNKYPLPLVDPSFEPFKKATVFTQLGLRNTYHALWSHE